MIPTFLDLRTGKTAKGSDNSVFWWAEGNGSCDCNRAIAFEGVDDEMFAQQKRDKPQLKPWQSYCYGCKRFIAIDVEGDLSDGEDALGKPIPYTKEQVLVALNAEYGK